MIQVETPVVPSFDKAMSEAEWSEHQALVARDADEKRAAAEQLALGRLEEARLRMLQDEHEQAERAWAAQLALVRAVFLHACRRTNSPAPYELPSIDWCMSSSLSNSVARRQCDRTLEVVMGIVAAR